MSISLRNAVRWAVPVALAWSSPALMALGLGNASVESYLNQPLRARIDLIAQPGDDLGAVTANLASADDFALIGARREAISVPLRFQVQQEGAGASILVTSTLPVRDPIIRLIVEVGWPGGRMLREYTLFLDPPTVAAEAPAPLVDERGGRKPTLAERAEAGAQTAAASEAGTQPESARGAVPAEGDYGPVQAGDTLWRIASDWSASAGAGLGVNQVMLAIQRNNPQAFINDNINLLKRGAILRLPTVEEVESVSPEAARAAVLEQTAAFAGGDAAAPSAAVDTPLLDEASPAPVVSAGDAGSSADAQLEIVPPSEGEGVESAYGTEQAGSAAEASTSTDALRQELARTEEELISERQQNDYLRDRIAELENQASAAPADTAGTVSDPTLAAAENRLREEREAAAAAATPPAAPRVSAPARQDEEAPWYRRVTTWLIALLLLGAGGAGWILNRRRAQPIVVAGPAVAAQERAVRGIKDEAEKILRVLEPATTPEPKPVAEPPPSPPPAATTPAGTPGRDEAELLDEASEDPEVRLDLARAYVAMGDREAARVILDEVIQHGNEEQQAEARSMLKEL